MVLHVGAQNWYVTDVHSLEWQAMNFWHGSIVRWAVPVFVMVSGALFLSRDIPLKKLYTKYIRRIFTAFMFWSFVYACARYAVDKDALKATGYFLKGRYHLWFLFMITGLYMIVPFMKKIAESGQLTKYFLVLAFFFTFLFPEAVSLVSLFSVKYGEFANGLLKNFHLQFVGGYCGYFLFGHFLNRAQISPKAERLIYVLGIAGVFAGMFLSVTASLLTGKPNQVFYGNLTVNSMFEAVAVFVFFRQRLNFPSRLIRTLSQYSFGAYLVHDAVIKALMMLGLNTLTFSPVISVPAISLLVFAISFAVSAVLNHVPVLRRYIV